ncbi:MAG TPA: HAMP domain-containing sensor histidine kinase [Pseudonocardiaceae bacterium]|nr:HAMP domain-containing sensor histidine kinase [Pseudonocardiaceae bacterium]
MSRAARRIGLQTAASVVVAAVGLAAVAVLVDLYSQHRAEDALLERSIARADVTDPPEGVWLVVRRGGHDEVTPGLPPGLPENRRFDELAAHHGSSTVVVSTHGRQFRVTTQPLAGGGAVQAVLDLRDDEDARRRLLTAFLVAGLVGLAVSTGVGLLLARRSVRPLAAALALQRRFVADASHELRTPLTLLTTRAQLIDRRLRRGVGTDVELVRTDVGLLVADARHLTAILEDLLLAVDPREARDVGRVPLESVVAQATESAGPLADEHGVTLSWVTVGEPRPVIGAEAALRRAVTALVDNAIRHAHGEVRITTTAAGDEVIVDVADDGPGIAPEMASTLFDRFTTSPSDGLSGTHRRYGIGLALVSEIAFRHGGSVALVDDGSTGATLRLRIPVGRE